MAGKSQDDTEDKARKAEAPQFPATNVDDVFGVLKYRGKPKSLEEMDAGIARMVAERHKRGRY